MGQLNERKLQSFIGKMLGDLGGAFNVPRRCGSVFAWGCSMRCTRAGPQPLLNSPNAPEDGQPATTGNGRLLGRPMDSSM
jgi:hypothetical protein